MNIRPFQIFVLAMFVILAILALFLLSGYSASQRNADQPYGDRVVIWGTLDPDVFIDVVNDLENENTGLEVVQYQYIDPRNFNTTFVNAVAEGRSPDLVLLPSSELIRQRAKLLAISYDTLSQRTFKDSYIDGAEIFARVDGIYALPLLVDPLVLYWNRDIFATAGLAEAPTTWEYIVNSVVPNIVRRDNQRNIIQAALAMGEVRNVSYAKEILLALAMQAGSKLVTETNGQYQVAINRTQTGVGLPPLEAAVQFFVNFSDVNNRLYNWNRSQPLDRSEFIAGELAMYIGLGSEIFALQAQNPNLNFDMAALPQGASATVRRTFGEFYGFAIPKASMNSAGAYLVAQALTQPAIATEFANVYTMAPAARSALAAGASDPYKQIIYRETLSARTWLDPNPETTDAAFQAMIEDVTSGRESLNAAVTDGEQRIRLSF